MRRLSLSVLSACFLLLAAGGCRMVSGLIHDRDAVARVGEHVLYAAEVQAVIPSGLPEEDSLRMVRSYIDSWATDCLLLDKAVQQLSSTAKDVSKPLEDYRRALLKYRYEQQYVNERLDTVITEGQAESYYESHREQFRLDAPLLKARFMQFSSKTPVRETLRSRLAADEDPAADSTFLRYVLRYSDFGGDWTALPAVAREMGTGADELLGMMRGKEVERSAGEGVTNCLRILEILQTGEYMPFSYCEKQIRDILLSIRKQELVASLERDLLEDARTHEKLIVFDE